MNTLKTYGLGGVALVIAILALFTHPATVTVPVSSHSLGGVTNYDTLQAQTMKVGTSTGVSNISFVSTGSCGLIFPSTVSTIAASTTVAADCAITGVIPGDTVLTQFATSSAVGEGWRIQGSSASTTNGFITIRFVNATGAAAAIPVAIASTTQYIVTRTQTGNAGI